MGRVMLELQSEEYRALRGHLLPKRRLPREEAAFVFASMESDEEETILRCVEWMAVESRGFEYQGAAYLELTDAWRASVIKRAHDLGASLVEFHSHPFPGPAAFSASDLMGLEEFVPHVWWRLKGRPFAAVVVAPSGFDALAWITGPKDPQSLDGIRVGRELLRPSGLSFRGEPWTSDSTGM